MIIHQSGNVKAPSIIIIKYSGNIYNRKRQNGGSLSVDITGNISGHFVGQ